MSETRCENSDGGKGLGFIRRWLTLWVGLCVMLISLASSGCSRARSCGTGPEGHKGAQASPGDGEKPDGDNLRPSTGKPREGNEKTCASCHEEQNRFWAYGGHASIACADCHEVKGDHVASKAKPLLGGNRQCLECHDLVEAGAKKNMTEAEVLEQHMLYLETKHVIKVKRKKTEKRCVQCHDQHLGQ